MRASVVLILALSIFASVSFAADDLPHPLFGFSGNWDSAGQTYIPSIASDGTCTVGTSLYRYAWFNITFNGNGVRRFSSFEDFSYVLTYVGGFNPSNPCQNSPMYIEDDRYNTRYDQDSYFYALGGVSYTFLVVDSSTYGSFTGIITEGWQGATSNTTTTTWNPIYITSSDTCYATDQTGYKPFYSKLPFTVNSTGYYDLEAYFARWADGTYPSRAYLAIYKGNPNASLDTDACGAVGDGVELVDATYEYYQYVELVAVRLVSGQAYTAVVSTYNNDFWGPFGFRYTTTRRFNFTAPTTTTGTTVGGFTEPPRDSTHYGLPGVDCTTNTNGYNNRPYAVVTFNVPNNYNFTVLTTEPTDYAFFMYTGENINPTQTCIASGRYIDFRDSGSERNFGPINANDFTIVATPWYQSSTDVPSYYTDVYVTYGAPITAGGPPIVVTTGDASTTGSTPVSTTGGTPTPVSTTGFVSTTGAISGVVSTTGGTVAPVSTTGRITTTTPAPPRSTTNSASAGARVAGVMLLLAFVAALL